MQRIITLLLVLFLQPSFSNAMPKFSIEPLGQTIFSIPSNSFSSVNYRVTNNTKISRTLTFKHINGVIQNIISVGFCSSPFTLNPGKSCILSLLAFDTGNGASISSGGPVVCKTTSANDNSPSPFLCSQPASNQELVIHQPTLQPGTLSCWGANSKEQAGQSPAAQRIDYPTEISSLENDVIMTSSGRGHSCALTSTGGVKCWGENNKGQLGNNSPLSTTTSIPQQVSGLSSGVIQISTGGNFTCALLANGTVQCWGLNSRGQLGNGTTANATTPTMVRNLAGSVVKVAANDESTCVLLASGSVQCWGSNDSGQLGIPLVTAQSSLPVLVQELNGVAVNIISGNEYSCVLMNSGKVYCWGNNNYGQLGNSTALGGSSYKPLEVQGLTKAPIFIRSAGLSACAIMSDKTAQCWGNNQYGQLGNGDGSGTAQNPNPVVVGGGTPLTSIADLRCSEWSCCALLESRQAQCWGRNNVSQLANASANVSDAPNPDPIDLNTSAIGNPLTNILKFSNIGREFTFCSIVS